MLFILFGLFGVLLEGIQSPNYDGSSIINFGSLIPNEWGIEYNIGFCNNNEFTISLNIDITTSSNENNIILGFGTQNTFFGLFIGINMRYIIYINMRTYINMCLCLYKI